MIVSKGVTLENALRPSNTQDANAYELAKAIHNVIHVIDPDQIIIECEMYKNTPDNFVELTRKILSETFQHNESMLPELTSSTCKYRHAHRGLTLRLREMWLHDLIMNGNI